jgi:hypothetical protein
MCNFELAVAYRTCPKVASPARGFSFGELQLSEICRRPFKESLETDDRGSHTSYVCTDKDS